MRSPPIRTVRLHTDRACRQVLTVCNLALHKLQKLYYQSNTILIQLYHRLVDARSCEITKPDQDRDIPEQSVKSTLHSTTKLYEILDGLEDYILTTRLWSLVLCLLVSPHFALEIGTAIASCILD